MTRSKLPLSLALGSAMAFAPAAVEAAVLVQDTFNREDSNALGNTSDGNDSWTEFEEAGDTHSDDRFVIEGNQLRVYHWAGDTTPGAALTSLKLADGVIDTEFDVIASNETYARRHVINYRAGSLASAATHTSGDAFHVVVRGDWGTTDPDLQLLYGSTELAGAEISDDVNADAFSIRVEFSGNSHQVYIEDTLLIDYTDPLNRNGEGSIGMSTYYSQMTVDYFTVSEIPEPASLALVGLGSLVMLSRGRRA